MTLDDLRQDIWDSYADLSPQMKVAASYILENPADVAFKSVRQLAKAADVHPSTVVRLAQVVGFSTFEPFRAVFQQGVQVRDVRFEDRAAALQKDGRWDTESDIFFEIGKATLGNLTSLFQPDTQKAVQRIAKAILDANRVYVSGYRSSFAFAHYLAYAGQIALPKIQLLESPDGSHFDVLGQADEKDLIILFTFAPYASEGGRLLTVAKKRGLQNRRHHGYHVLARSALRQHGLVRSHDGAAVAAVSGSCGIGLRAHIGGMHPAWRFGSRGQSAPLP